MVNNLSNLVSLFSCLQNIHKQTTISPHLFFICIFTIVARLIILYGLLLRASPSASRTPLNVSSFTVSPALVLSDTPLWSPFLSSSWYFNKSLQ